MKSFQRMLDRWIGKRPYEEAAPLLGVAVGTLHAYRHGTSLPPATRIPGLAAALGVPEAKLRQVIARERAARAHARNVAADPADANDTHGVRS